MNDPNPQTPPSNEQVSIIQADREAAASMWKDALGMGSPADWQAEWMADGTADSGPVVQAFARHRQAHSAPVADGAVKERARELLAGAYEHAGQKTGAEIIRSGEEVCGNDLYALRAIESALSAPASAGVREKAVEAMLNARVPGGAKVADWLPQADAWTPHKTAYAVMGAAYDALAALSASPPPEQEGMQAILAEQANDRMRRLGRDPSPLPNDRELVERLVKFADFETLSDIGPLLAQAARRITELSRLCEDCPPVGYPTDKTRCLPCPRRTNPDGGSNG